MGGESSDGFCCECHSAQPAELSQRAAQLVEHLSGTWAVYVSVFWHLVWDESWLAINPPPQIVKAGHPVSCSSLCMLCVVCLVSIVWWLGEVLGSFHFASWLVCYTHFSMCMYFA